MENTIQTQQEFDAALSVYAKILKQRNSLTAKKEAAVQKAVAKFEQELQVSTKAVAEGFNLLNKFAQSNPANFTEWHATKTAKTRLKKGAQSVSISTTDTEVIQHFITFNRQDALRHKTEIDKRAILSKPALVEGIEGISIKQGEPVLEIIAF